MLAILVRSRYLIQEFVTRDVRSRYLGSILGMFWSVLNPLFQLILYTVIFSLVLKVRFGPGETTGAFALMVFCALLPWTAIQESTTRSARGFLEHSNLIKKLSFPLETIPFSYVCSAAIHQILGWIVFLIILLVFGSLQLQHLFLLPILFLVQLVLMFGLSLIFGCLNVFFRDVSQLLGVGFMFLFWMTPIVYPKEQAPAAFQWILNLNPVTHMVEGYRYAFFGTPAPLLWGVLYWITVSLGCVLLGGFILKRVRSDLLDLL